MKTLLILGNDRISVRALTQLETRDPMLHIAKDESNSLRRLFRLIARGRLSLPLVFRMALCELKREPKSQANCFDVIKSNRDLLDLIERVKPDRVMLFRAGLIIGPAVIDQGLPILNIHCADIPKYGGLGSIWKALEEGAIHQAACLHQVTTTIDEGEVFDREPYLLNLSKTYCWNENTAYEAGIRLLQRNITVT